LLTIFSVLLMSDTLESLSRIEAALDDLCDHMSVLYSPPNFLSAAELEAATFDEYGVARDSRAAHAYLSSAAAVATAQFVLCQSLGVPPPQVVKTSLRAVGRLYKDLMPESSRKRPANAPPSEVPAKRAN
jgi:uncharacterized membrane protein YccC